MRNALCHPNGALTTAQFDQSVGHIRILLDQLLASGSENVRMEVTNQTQVINEARKLIYIKKNFTCLINSMGGSNVQHKISDVQTSVFIIC